MAKSELVVRLFSLVRRRRHNYLGLPSVFRMTVGAREGLGIFCPFPPSAVLLRFDPSSPFTFGGFSPSFYSKSLYSKGLAGLVMAFPP